MGNVNKKAAAPPKKPEIPLLVATDKVAGDLTDRCIERNGGAEDVAWSKMAS